MAKKKPYIRDMSEDAITMYTTLKVAEAAFNKSLSKHSKGDGSISDELMAEIYEKSIKELSTKDDDSEGIK